MPDAFVLFCPSFYSLIFQIVKVSKCFACRVLKASTANKGSQAEKRDPC